jgi:hypothetical protein
MARADQDHRDDQRRADLQHGGIHAEVHSEVAVKQVAEPGAEYEPDQGPDYPVESDPCQVVAQHLAPARPDRLHGADHRHLLCDQGRDRAEQQEDGEEERHHGQELHDREGGGYSRA